MENEEVQPEDVQEDIKPLIDDYLERGEDDFEEFEDVDDMYAQFIDQLDGLETQMPASTVLQVPPGSLPLAAAFISPRIVQEVPCLLLADGVEPASCLLCCNIRVASADWPWAMHLHSALPCICKASLCCQEP